MAKRKGAKLHGGSGRPAGSARQTAASATIPSAQTLFRFTLVDTQTRDLLDKATLAMRSLLWKRDGASVRQIEAARTAEELLDLLPLANGLAEPVWLERMRRFGSQAVFLISARLRAVSNSRSSEARHLAYEKLIALLRWQGEAGAQALLEVFDALDDYGKSLACVVLGLLGARGSADKLWAFYERAARDRRETHYVGALWGLIDLKDGRAGEVLADLLKAGQDFYELIPFLSLAGDERAVRPLMAMAALLPEDEKLTPLTALVGIAHRTGREALLAAVDATTPAEREAAERIADQLLAQPADAVAEYFASFYRGVRPEDLARAL